MKQILLQLKEGQEVGQNQNEDANLRASKKWNTR